MTVTVIKQDNTVKQIFFWGVTDQVKVWVNQLNDNPLTEGWTYEEQYVEKSIWDLKEFLNIR